MKIFITHALQDDFYFQQLLKHLHPLQQQGLIEVEHSQKILAGYKTKETLREQLASADIIMPLLSADFLVEEANMRTVEAEQKRRNVLIVPVLLRYCQWELTFFKDFKILPHTNYPLQDTHWKSTDYAMDLVVDELKLLVQKTVSKIGEEAAKKEAESPNKKMALLIKTMEVRPSPNERGQLLPVFVSDEVKTKLDEYLKATETMLAIEVEGVPFTRAELLTKKASLEFGEAYHKGWKKHIELQNRSFFSLTKDLENLGNTGLFMYKRYQVNNMLKEARTLEPENVETLLESIRFVMAVKPKDIQQKTNYITQIENILNNPKTHQERLQLALTRLYKSIQPPKITASLMKSVRADFEAIGEKNYVAYCDWLLSGANFIGG
ncbi:MAG: hypothetical protein AB8B69_05030 [Chitinophagales bacterium]